MTRLTATAACAGSFLSMECPLNHRAEFSLVQSGLSNSILNPSHTSKMIGASLSEPHTSEFNGGIFIYYIYISVVRRSVNAS